MFKKLLLIVAMLLATAGFAYAAVEVNTADQAALDGIKGIGPSTTAKILDERKKGAFKDWADFESRVKGIKDKRAAKLSAAGLTINGQSFAGAPANTDAAPAKKSSKKAAADSATPTK